MSQLRRGGFTLLELLISLGVIGVLTGLVIVSLQGVRTSASRAKSLNSLRGLTQAYAGYSTDHLGRLLPGYLDEQALMDLDITAELKNGELLDECTSMRCDAGSYVWRLAPYVDHVTSVMFTDYASSNLTAILSSEVSNEVFGPGSVQGGDLGLARIPSYGLNSIFLGGDTVHGGPDVVSLNPFNNPTNSIAATSMNIPNTRVVVFGATQHAIEAERIDPRLPEVSLGYAELRPPFTDVNADWTGDPSTRQWEIVDNDIVATGVGLYGEGGGWPIGRWGENNIPISHLDGSVEVVERYELGLNMKYWSPEVTGYR